jgi:hypothetical protein
MPGAAAVRGNGLAREPIRAGAFVLDDHAGALTADAENTSATPIHNQHDRASFEARSVQRTRAQIRVHQHVQHPKHNEHSRRHQHETRRPTDSAKHHVWNGA